MSIWGTVAGGLTQIGGSIIQSNAADDAAEAQAAAANNAIGLQEAMWRRQLADNAPFRQTGLSALSGNGGLFKRTNSKTWNPTKGESDHFYTTRMNQVRNEFKGRSDAEYEDMVARSWAEHVKAQNAIQEQNGEYEVDPELTRSFTMADFQADPGYEFRMKEGQKALERSNAAKHGGGMSGGRLKALARYGQDFASNEYANAYNRFNNDRTNRFNRLTTLAGFGSNANAANAAASQNYANQSGSYMIGAGDAQAAAANTKGQIWGNTLSNLGKQGMDYYSKKGG